jgi:hypothetical protein
MGSSCCNPKRNMKVKELMKNPSKILNIDKKHADKLIGQTKDVNNQTIDYKDLHIGPEFMLKELFSNNNKSEATMKYFARKKKWDEMSKIHSNKSNNDYK